MLDISQDGVHMSVMLSGVGNTYQHSASTEHMQFEQVHKTRDRYISQIRCCLPLPLSLPSTPPFPFYPSLPLPSSIPLPSTIPPPPQDSVKTDAASIPYSVNYHKTDVNSRRLGKNTFAIRPTKSAHRNNRSKQVQEESVGLFYLFSSLSF